MANTMTGRVIEVRPTQTMTTKMGTQFSKRELILDCTRFDPYTGERGYENTPVFTFTQNNCALLDSLAPGMIVTVSFDISGRRSNDPAKATQYYNDVRGYKVEVVRQAAEAPQSVSAAPQPIARQMPAPTPQMQQSMPQQAYMSPQQPAAPYGQENPREPFSFNPYK